MGVIASTSCPITLLPHALAQIRALEQTRGPGVRKARGRCSRTAGAITRIWWATVKLPTPVADVETVHQTQIQAGQEPVRWKTRWRPDHREGGGSDEQRRGMGSEVSRA